MDTEHVDASYDQGVLTLRIPVSEAAKPPRLQVHSASRQATIADASSN